MNFGYPNSDFGYPNFESGYPNSKSGYPFFYNELKHSRKDSRMKIISNYKNVSKLCTEHKIAFTYF